MRITQLIATNCLPFSGMFLPDNMEGSCAMEVSGFEGLEVIVRTNNGFGEETRIL